MATRVEDLALAEAKDLSDNPSREEYLEEVARQRSQNWIGKTSFGYSVVTHEDSISLLRERRLHQASQLVGKLIAGTGTALDQLDDSNGILSAEGEDHNRLRRLVARPFSAKAIDELRPFMRDYVQNVLGKVHESGDTASFEFQAAFNEYPIAVICHQVGVAEKDWDLFSYWADLLFIRWSPLIIGREQEFVDAMGDFRSYCLNLIEERRANLGNDLLSALIQVEEEGDRLSTDELVGLVQGMIAAGTDTTRNQLGIMISLLAERPETWSQLRNDKELIANTVEESLRYVNPIRTVIRQVAEEFEYRDVIFSPGQLITFSLSSANRDASEFDTADDFDVTRSDARNHLTFSSGIHHCLGAALARAELQEALQVFVETWSEVSPDASPTWKHGRLAIWGPKTVPLKVTRN